MKQHVLVESPDNLFCYICGDRPHVVQRGKNQITELWHAHLKCPSCGESSFSFGKTISESEKCVRAEWSRRYRKAASYWLTQKSMDEDVAVTEDVQEEDNAPGC